MLPILAIAAANIGRNLLQSAASGPVNRTPDPAKETDPAAFQKLLQQVSASPEVQKASFLASEGISNTTDAQQKLGDLGARIMQDPGVQKAIAGSNSAVEMRFLADGSVSIKTSDGRQKTVEVQGDAKVAASKASRIVKIMQSADGSAGGAAGVALTPGGTSKELGIRIVPGEGAARLLF